MALSSLAERYLSMLEISGEHYLLSVQEDASASKRANEALRASDQRFRVLRSSRPSVSLLLTLQDGAFTSTVGGTRCPASRRMTFQRSRSWLRFIPTTNGTCGRSGKRR